jgi:hypothetical protein
LSASSWKANHTTKRHNKEEGNTNAPIQREKSESSKKAKRNSSAYKRGISDGVCVLRDPPGQHQ